MYINICKDVVWQTELKDAKSYYLIKKRGIHKEQCKKQISTMYIRVVFISNLE